MFSYGISVFHVSYQKLHNRQNRTSKNVPVFHIFLKLSCFPEIDFFGYIHCAVPLYLICSHTVANEVENSAGPKTGKYMLECSSFFL